MITKDLNERKAILRRIIPQLHISTASVGGARSGGLNWKEYFTTHPVDADKLGYTEPNAGKGGTIWAANNVLARSLMEKEQIATRKNGLSLKLPSPAGTLLTDTVERRQLLMEIYPQLENGPSGAKSWKRWFETHPEHAQALGYDQLHTRPKLWAANLRIAQQPKFQREVLVPQTPLVPYKVETIDTDEAARQVAGKMAQMQAENRLLRDRIKEMEELNSNCRAELDGAKTIIFELSMQLVAAKKK